MKVGQKNRKKIRFFFGYNQFFLPTFMGELKGFFPGFKITKNS